MTTQVNIGDAKATLSDLVKRIEGGEEIVIARGNEPVVRMVREQSKLDPKEIVAQIIRRRETLRARGVRITREDIREGIEEGRA